MKVDEDFTQALNAAIRHAVNFHGLDSTVGMEDYKIANFLTPEVVKHLEDRTVVQILARARSWERENIR